MTGASAAYHAHRLSLGVVDGAMDLVSGKTIPLEANFHEMGAISFDKGCYLGQELTARTHHQGLLRKRYWPMNIHGEGPLSFGESVLQESRPVGQVASFSESIAMVRIRLEALKTSQNLRVQEHILLKPRKSFFDYL